MSLYIDSQSKIHDDMDGTAIHLLPSDCVKITDAAAEELRKPSQTDTNSQRKDEILAELDTIDAKSIRPIREGDTKRLADLDEQAQALRDELKSL